MVNDEVAAKRGGREITQSERDWYDAADDAETVAADRFVSTAPATMAGLAAAIAWLLEYDRQCTLDTSGQFLRTLAASPLLVGG
ncbi:hypothetical protein Nham_0370 [Nitrobacter hamburgensis X14]|uniref:Uncharacterized protein n=1 Tax=Nitrobacter hamburgensis (strain DSM 10229 / NCIMB 13809 / X14) TaxID=323097 RepID=Q1QR82_NITHX|nr:hypothetical protein Nham_0370 [Nitrobacter hamburgensis X14]